MFCLLVMTLYCLIFCAKGGAVSEREHNDSIEAVRLSQAMQKHILIMFCTNIACWVAFIIISVLHNLLIIDAANWYATFALIVLPIKAVINPLLYDSTITEFILSKVPGARASAGGSQIELARLEPEGGSEGPGKALLEKENAVKPDASDDKTDGRSDMNESNSSSSKE